jgi:hypothetical protein
VLIQQIADSLAVEIAEVNSAINSRSRILLGIHSGYGVSVHSQPPREYGFCRIKAAPVYEDNTACIEWGNNVIGGRERAKHIDIRKHFAHEVIQNGHIKLVRVSTTSQLADIVTKPLHYPQYLACVAGILGSKVVTT